MSNTNTHTSAFSYRRTYTGPLQGVILDWSGTVVDYGCFAPAVVFIDVFKDEGVALSMAEARGPMGLYKRDHIRQIIEMPSVAGRWQEAHGRLPDDGDVERLYQAFIPRQIDCILAYADLIPGATEAVTAFRARGLKIGSSTGYTRPMMERLLPEVKKRGYEPDSLVCPDEVPAGRPLPWMCFANAMKLGVYPMEALVKIGDTFPDIAEGLNAGMWTIGLTQTGNELGLSEAEAESLSADALAARVQPIAQKMYQAGAHYVINSLSNAPAALDQIEMRLRHGERP